MGGVLSVWSPRPGAPEKIEVSSTVTLYGLPMMAIAPVAIEAEHQRGVQTSDALLFTSQHAVEHLCSQLPPRLLAGKHIIAIGEKTAATLRQCGLSVTLSAKAPCNSESLLADEAFHMLEYDSVALIAGVGGRQVLESTLTQLGKKVIRVACYRRDKCHVAPQIMLEFINNYGINAIVLTSCEIVDAVVCQRQRGGMPPDWQIPAFALSQRIADYAKSLGFSQVIVAEEASQASLYHRLQTWAQQ